MSRAAALLALCVAVLLSGGEAFARAEEPTPEVLRKPADIAALARIEPEILVPRLSYPAGQPVLVVLQLRNPSSVPVDLPQECLTAASWRVQRASDMAVLQGKGRVTKEKIPGLGPAEARSLDVDLRKIFKGVEAAGLYRIQWRCGEWQTQVFEFVVAASYDRERDRVAVMTTDVGTMELVMMPEHAPEHVRNFVELARAGYYDGVIFYRILPGISVETGDRRGDGAGGWVQQMQPEISNEITPGRGLVGAVRRQTSVTSASLFFILLGPQPTFQGKHTFFAYVRKGDEVLDVLSALTATAPDVSLPYRPLKDVRIQRIEIREN